MKLKRGRIMLSVFGTTTFLIFSAWLYDYGTPIEFQLIGTQLDGTEVQLPKEWVHLAYTPLYSTAIAFRSFIDSMGTLVYALGIVSGFTAPFIKQFAKWLFWFLTAGKHVKSDKDASGFPFYGFYKGF